jgi:hypothetical protein
MWLTPVGDGGEGLGVLHRYRKHGALERPPTAYERARLRRRLVNRLLSIAIVNSYWQAARGIAMVLDCACYSRVHLQVAIPQATAGSPCSKVTQNTHIYLRQLQTQQRV